MLVTTATLALLTLQLSLLAASAALLARGRGGWRLVGGALAAQALLVVAALVALSTLPFGIGEPLIRVGLPDLLLQTALGLLGTAGVAVAVLLAARRARALRPPTRRRLAAGLLAALPLVSAAALYGLAQASLPQRERERDPAKRQIALPEGFRWDIYLQGTIDNPTAVAFGPDGTLYIADIAGAIWAASDADGDMRADRIVRWADGFELLLGLAWRDGELYAASAGKIEALRDSDADGRADARRLLVDGLPSMVLKPHSNNGIAFGPDGRLYFGVGSTTSGQYEADEQAAAVLSVNPDGSDLRVFARGFGNPFAVAFNRDGQLFGGDNSPMGGPREELPDEFNHIVEGGHYGYPYFYGQAPSAGTTGALSTFPPHASPTGLTFYGGVGFGREYQDNAFVTLWNRGEIARVELARTSGGDYLSRVSTFAGGFLYPIAATVGSDGSLYVADFGTSAVYRISRR